VACGRARGGVEAHIARGEPARGADGAEGRCVELEVVPAAVEVGERVGIRRAELAEGVAVLARAAGERVVARAALDPVVSGVAVDRVVAGAAAHGIGAVAALQEIVAA